MSGIRFIWLLVIGILFTGVSEAEFTLNVMSFNLRHGLAEDGPNSWSFRKDIVVDCIKQSGVDLVGTQECRDFQADYIGDKLPEYGVISMAREADGSGEHMTVFYDKKVLAPMETGNFWLSETPDVPGSRSWDSACTRMVTWARFYHNEQKCFFYHFNTHFDHMSEPARQASAHLLIKRITEQAGDNTPIVITGDFNATAEQSETWRIITGGGFADAWVTAQEKVGPALTISHWAAPVEGEVNRIDWIMLSKQVRSLRCETVLFNLDGRYPTDHYPVLARLVVDGASAP